MIKKIGKINVSLISFLAYTTKMMIFSPSFADSIVVGVLAGLYGYSLYLKRFQPVMLDDRVQKDLLEVKSALSKLNLAKISSPEQKKKYF